MAKPSRELKGTRPQQGIEELQQRYQTLNEKRITAEANLENAQNRLNDLKKDARAKYGTDDIEQLQRMLQEMRAENERKRSSYQQELDRIEDALQEVENRFEQAQTSDEAV
jgi:hypothetical protein